MYKLIFYLLNYFIIKVRTGADVKLKKNMKKLFVILISAVYVLTACSPYEPSEAVTADMLKKATILGTVYIDLDGKVETAKAGTLLFAVNFAEFGNYTKSVPVDNKGAYSTEFPVEDAGNDVTITGVLVLENGQVFEVNHTLAVKPEGTFVAYLTYVKTQDPITPPDWKDAILEFTLRYIDSDAAAAVLVDVPANTPIRLKFAGETTYVETTVKTGGRVSFMVKAPTVLDGGKNVEVYTTAMLPYTTGAGTATEVRENKIFSYSNSSFKIYGGEITTPNPLVQTMTMEP